MESNTLDYEVNFNMEDQKPVFTTAGDTKPTNSTDGRMMNSNGPKALFSALATPFQSRNGNEQLCMLSQQEPRHADTAPSAANVDIMNYAGSSDLLFDDGDASSNNYYMGSNRPESVSSSHANLLGNSRCESVASSHGNLWNEGPAVQVARNGEMVDTFDFLVKSLSSANNFVSMLTREQLSVLRSIRPGLLYEFLLEVAKVRGDKRLRRALPNECAFCKNNGENEDCYSSHALKDHRGRVTCPVLRAFRCPRCGATGDRAHTIKYCQETELAPERAGLSFRRRGPQASLFLGSPLHSGSHAAFSTPTPAPSPAPASHSNSNQNSIWSPFGMN